MIPASIRNKNPDCGENGYKIGFSGVEDYNAIQFNEKNGMAMKTLSLTADRARELFTYDADSGVLKWRFRKGTKIRPDLNAGYIDHEGYRVVRVDGVNYRGHRICWLIQTGAWPADMLDHINGDRSDNRWSNLREADNSENQQNKKKGSANASGYKGVSVIRRRGRIQYRAAVYCRGVTKYSRNFNTVEEAREFYCREAARIFGEFARP